MQFSTKGERFLMNEEGFKKNKLGLHIPYKCAAGKWTISYGVCITEEQAEQFKDGIDEKTALEMFRKRYAQDVAAINTVVRQPLTQNQFDSLVSFSFNIGSDGFKKSTLVKMINNRQFFNAADQFERWCHINGNQVCEGLLNRRKREKALFLKKEI